MRTLLVLVFALALTIPLAPVPAESPQPACAAADAAAFHEVRVKGPLPGFSGWTEAVGYSLDRLPMTPTLLAVRDADGATCDLTHDVAAFLGARAAERPAESALLAARAVFVDVLPDAEIRGEPVVADGDVAMTVWTPRNGVVADVTVALADMDVSFVVRERAVGEFVGEPEGWNLLPGDSDAIVTGDVGALATKVIFGTNADGTQWRVTYFTERYSSVAQADFHATMHRDAAVAAYDFFHANGYASADPDRILDLTLDGCDCIFGTPNANIHMFPRAWDILPLLPGLAYRTEAETALLIVGHELFHHFQYGIQQWRMGNWMTEGQARWSETVHVPDATFLPTTLTYFGGDNSMNGFLASPNREISQHTYDWSIVWGWIAAANGGLALAKAVLEESATGGTNANTDGVAAIDRALARVPGGAHATFEEAYAEFAADIFTRNEFTWGRPDGSQSHDWATYFIPVPVEPAFAGTREVRTWGIFVLDASPQNANLGGTVRAVVADDANTWTRLVAGDTVVNAAPLASVSGEPIVRLVAVRSTSSMGPDNPLLWPQSGKLLPVLVR